jgi:ATP-dependent DNA helicase RecG
MQRYLRLLTLAAAGLFAMQYLDLPVWKNEPLGVRLTLYAATSQPQPMELNERQKALLDSLAGGERITTREFLDRFGSGLSERQARRDLSQLEDAGLLERVGAGPSTAYQISETPS